MNDKQGKKKCGNLA